jgi:hypothetical protein
MVALDTFFGQWVTHLGEWVEHCMDWHVKRPSRGKKGKLSYIWRPRWDLRNLWQVRVIVH